MQLIKNQPKTSEVELTIEVSATEYQPFLEKAANRLSQESKIEGFRPGKAPYELIKTRFGEMAIFQAALDDIISHFYFQAVKQENLNTVAAPKIEVEKLAPGNTLVFKALVGLMPTIKLGDYKTIKVTKEEIKVDDKEVEKMINDLRKMRAQEVVVERAVKQGDFTEVDFTVSLDGVVIDGGTSKKYPLVIGEGTMIPGFEDQLVGMNKDEEKNFQLKFPDQYQNKMLSGKMCDFKVKVLSVYERTLPEVNDDWVKTLGASNVTDLKTKIKDNLSQEQSFQIEQKAEMEMLNKIVEQTEFSEIPEVLVENEAHRMVHEFEDSIESQGLSFTDYLASIKKEEKDLTAEFKPKALERVKASLVIKEIADNEKVEAIPEELQKETEQILTQVKDNPEAEANIKSEGYQHYLQTVVRNRKVIKILKSIILGE